MSTVGVETNNGFKFASQVTKQDSLITARGRLNPIREIFHHKYFGELARIDLRWNNKRNYYLRGITPNHQVKTDRGYIRVDDLKKGDNLYGMAKPCPYCKKLIPFRKSYCSIACQNKYVSEVLGVDHWKKGRQRIIEKYGSFRNMSILSQSGLHSCQSQKRVGSHIENLVESWLKRLGLKYEKQFKVIVGNYKLKYHLDRNGLGQFVKNPKNFGQKEVPRCRFVDFYVPDEKWFIEADGVLWHDEEKDRKRDIEILREHPDHKITHIEFGKIIKHETFTLTDLVTNNGHIKFVPMEVRDIEYYKNKWNKVWNFSVEPDQSYVIGGARIVVHNCRCFWDVRIAL